MKYVVQGGTAEFGTDMVLSLSKDQVAARAHALEEVEGGHRPKSVVQFKVGETLGVDRAPDKLPGKLGEVLAPAGAKDKATVAQRRTTRRRRAKKAEG